MSSKIYRADAQCYMGKLKGSCEYQFWRPESGTILKSFPWESHLESHWDPGKAS